MMHLAKALKEGSGNLSLEDVREPEMWKLSVLKPQEAAIFSAQLYWMLWARAIKLKASSKFVIKSDGGTNSSSPQGREIEVPMDKEKILDFKSPILKQKLKTDFETFFKQNCFSIRIHLNCYSNQKVQRGWWKASHPIYWVQISPPRGFLDIFHVYIQLFSWFYVFSRTMTWRGFFVFVFSPESFLLFKC